MHTIVDIILEAHPDSLELLRRQVKILAIKEDPKVQGAPSFARLKRIAQLHFISLQICEDRHYDPLLIFENNFDGDPNSYWGKVLHEVGEDLRAIFACTKPAIEPQWQPVFASGSTVSLEPFIKAFSVFPSASHIGTVGITADRVKQDRIVFDEIQKHLGDAAPQYRNLEANVIQNKLRIWASSTFPWMNTAMLGDIKKEKWRYRWAALRRILPFIFATAIAIFVDAFFCVSDFLLSHGYPVARSSLITLNIALFVALTIFITRFWATLRRLEESDSVQDNPQLDAARLNAFSAQEDHIVQNHIAVMNPVKPGVVRSIAIRSSLKLLKLFVPVLAADGYLGSMRTIHFAHWTLVGNGGRLLFLSNFDGSWQSYLDDFVDKAHSGLTLAWSNCIGFPRTRNLIREGATHGTQFKTWARHSQVESALWYSAYSDLTVNQILRNAAIVDGLCKSEMTEVEARKWAEML